MTLKVKVQEKLVKFSKNDLGTHRPGRYELRRGVGKEEGSLTTTNSVATQLPHHLPEFIVIFFLSLI